MGPLSLISKPQQKFCEAALLSPLFLLQPHPVYPNSTNSRCATLCGNLVNNLLGNEMMNNLNFGGYGINKSPSVHFVA